MRDTEHTEILALLRAGDERALSETAARYGGMCLRLAQNILGSREDAEEVVNDALMQLWQTAPDALPRNPEAFLVTVTRRNALKYLEKRTAAKRGGNAAQVTEDLEQILRAADDVEAACDSRAVQQVIRQFLGTLPQEQQAMFIQRYWYFCTSREIAKELHLRAGSVRVTLMRLRSQLKAMLEKEGLL